jgi:KDO2-lipid IV(A) lauroyltransferase
MRVREGSADFWIWSLSKLSEHAPWFVDAVRPLVIDGIWYSSVTIRRATLANARRILGEGSTHAQRVRMGKGVVRSFYDFFGEVGRNSKRTRHEMLVEVEQVIGHEKYVAARASGRGAVVAVAHMGSFEVATAAMREMEPSIHVVFKRDPRAHWEKLRQALHRKLEVHETPVDDGWGIWYHLRDRLRNNDVVLIQADRVMPGQRGVKLPFLGGHLEVPTGPVKLAMAAGCPVIPVFAVRVGPRQVRIIIEDAIEVEGGLKDVGPGMGPHPALVRLTNVIASYVEKYPEQWLLLNPAFAEDQEIA